MTEIMISDEELIDKAKEAMQYSYSPYSNFKVGAAVLSETGNVYTGCNIENASYGATVCAERTAIFKAVSLGDSKLVKIAVVSQTGKLTPPCGICRQVMAEFMDKDSTILLEDTGNKQTYLLKDLLPLAFTEDDMK